MTDRLLNDPRQPDNDPGLWIEQTGDLSRFAGKPALFLDRDGVINIDSGYPARPSDITIIETIVAPVQRANAAGWPVVVVTNQSGIAQNFFNWNDFADVTAHIHAELKLRGARLDLVLACAYYKGGRPPLDVADHPMRKPNPGMLLKAAKFVGMDLGKSLMVGDRSSDFAAAAGAGLRTGFAENFKTMALEFTERSFTIRSLAELTAAIA